MPDKKMQTAPDGVVFDVAPKAVLKLALQADTAVALVCREVDYLCLGKSIKDKLEEYKVDLSTVVVENDFLPEVTHYVRLFSFAKPTKLFVAVGNASVCNLARFYALCFGAEVVCVPTDLCFMGLFTPNANLVENGVLTNFAVQECQKIVIDLQVLAVLKKQAFADAFCQISSLVVSAIDAYVTAVVSGDATCVGAVNLALKEISKLTYLSLTENQLKIAVINAELRLGLLSKKYPQFAFGNQQSVAFLLNAITPCQIFEAEFWLSTYLLRLYEVFLVCDMNKTDVCPDYNARIKELYLLLDTSAYGVTKKYQPQDFAQICNANNALRSSRVLEYVKNCQKLLEKLKSAYGIIYKGREARVDFPLKHLRRAVALAPYMGGGGLLKIMGDMGVTDMLLANFKIS